MWDVLSERAADLAKRVAAAHGGKNVRVLVPRSKASPDDIGCLVFLVDLDEGRSLLDLVALNEDLREALGMEVNVLTEGSLSPCLREAVLAEAAVL